MTTEDNKLHVKSQRPPCGQAAADGVNCFRFVSVQIRQLDGGADHQINHLSSVMPCLTEPLASGCLHLAWPTISIWTVLVSWVDMILSPGL